MSNEDDDIVDLASPQRLTNEHAMITVAFQKLRHELATAMLGLGHRIEKIEMTAQEARDAGKSASERLNKLELDAARAEATGRMQGAIAGIIVSVIIGIGLVVLRAVLGSS